MVLKTFVNEPEIVWGKEEIEKLQKELDYVKKQFNTNYPLFISDKKIMTKEKKHPLILVIMKKWSAM